MDGYELLTGELDAHAGRVDGLVERLRGAVAAASQVSADDSAFGVICQPFATMLTPFEQLGVQALRTAQDSVGETASSVRDAVRGYDAQETGSAQAFRGVGESLDG